jgi:hypothetical protein
VQRYERSAPGAPALDERRRNQAGDKLAVDAGAYERAALLDVAKRTTKAASVTPIDWGART